MSILPDPHAVAKKHSACVADVRSVGPPRCGRRRGRPVHRARRQLVGVVAEQRPRVRHRLVRRRTVDPAAVAGGVHLAARADLQPRLRARRPPLHAVLRSAHAVLRRHVGHGHGREHGPAHLGLGDHGPLLVHADRALVGGRLQQPLGTQGVLHRPRRRHRPARRYGDHLLRVRRLDRREPAGPERLRHQPPSRRGRCRATRPPAAPRSSSALRHCSSPASASRASSRCTPGSPTRWPAPPRCRRCCTRPRWSWPACSSCAGIYPVFWEGVQHRQRWPELHRHHRCDHDHHRRAARLRAGRHQEGARLLDGVTSSGT